MLDELGLVYRKAKFGRLDVSTASRLSFILKTIGDLAGNRAVSRQLQSIEEQLQRIGAAPAMDLVVVSPADDAPGEETP